MMAFRVQSTSLVIIVLVLCARQPIGVDASPTIAAAAPSLKPQEITGKLEPIASNNYSTVAATLQVEGAKISGLSGQQQLIITPSGGVKQAQSKANTAEKLKRGLTNFMNHLNAAAYFVPPAPPAATNPTNGKRPVVAASGSQTDPATIVNDGPTADVLIKGPTRLVQARPLGGPLRWGRR